MQKYRVRPIKWKGILHRLTLWSQKLGQYNSVASSLKMGLNFSHFEDYSKSARWMILFRLVTCYHTPTLHKNAEKPTVIWFFTQILIESTVLKYDIPVIHTSVKKKYPKICNKVKLIWVKNSNVPFLSKSGLIFFISRFIDDW